MLLSVFTSVSVPVGTQTDFRRLGERARRAEALGFDALFVTDHPAPSHQWLNSGGHPTLDPFVALSFVAAATTTLKVHTNLLVLGYRHPLITAKAVASLDVLSQGRVLLGVGVGYLAAEFAALQAPFDDRGRVAEANLATMQTAWLGRPFGPQGTVMMPRPTQRPHPDIWVGGNSKAAMRRAVELGTGWAPMPSPKGASSVLGTPGIESVAELATRVEFLNELVERSGRSDPLDVAVIPTELSGFADREPDPESVLHQVGELRGAGATALVVSLPDDGWDERLEWLATEVASKI